MATQTGSIDLTATRAVHFAAEAGFESINGNLTDNYYTKSEFTVEPGQIASVVKESAKQSAVPNIYPFFSTDFNDLAESTTSDDGYWYILDRDGYQKISDCVTVLSDGWAHWEYDNTSGSSLVGVGIIYARDTFGLKQDATYTAIFEVRNVTAPASGTSGWTLTTANSASSQIRYNASGFYLDYNEDLADGSTIVTKQFTANNWGAAKKWFGALYIGVSAGAALSVDVRISVYEGVYDGPFKPYVNQSLSSRMKSAETSIEQTANNVLIKATENDTTAAQGGQHLIQSLINVAPDGVTIDADKVNITGAAIFTSGRLSETSISNGLAAATESANAYADSLESGGHNILLHTIKPTYAGNYDATLTPEETTGWYRYATSITVTNTDDGIKMVHSSASSNSGFVIPFSRLNAVVGGDKVNLSFDYRGSITGTGRLYLMCQADGNVYVDGKTLVASETNWQHFSTNITWPSTSGKVTYAVLVPYIATKGGWLEIKNGSMMLERGSKDTGWTPAPEDVVSDMTSISTVASSAATKSDAVYRQQRIWYRQTVNGAAPSTNTTWLATSGTGYGNWSLSVPQLTSGTTKYPKLYTAVQTQTVSQAANGGTTCSCSPVRLDDSTTVIDGGNIITGSVSANSINASSGTFDTANIPNLSATKITSGDISADRIKANVISAINSLTAGTINGERINAAQLRIGGSSLATQTDVDNISIGVSNLLLETSTWGSKLWLDSSGAAIDGDTVTYASNNTSNKMALVPCSSGDVFTVSYDVKASVAVTYGASGGTILVDYSNSATSYNRVVYDTVARNSSVGTEWQRVSYTFTVPTNSSIKALTIGLRNMSPSTSCTLYFRYFKLERGNRATDWTPSPEDQTVVVGGRNLLKYSSDLYRCFGNTSKVTSIVGGHADPDGGIGAYLITPNATSWYVGATSGSCVLKNTSVPYTFSIWLRADSATQCNICCRYMDLTPYSTNAARITVNVTTEWQRFYISAPLKQAQTTDSVWIGQVTNVPIYAYHPMVEISTHPSDWAPAPEDTWRNLGPFSSWPLTDVYNATNNKDGYWRSNIGGTSYFTKLDDGWIHFERNQSSATTTNGYADTTVFRPKAIPNLTLGNRYTILIETRNNTSTGGGNSSVYIQQTAGNQFWGNSCVSNEFGTTTCSLYPANTNQSNYIGTGCSVHFVKVSDTTHQTATTNECMRINIRTYDGDQLSFDFRVSVYEGDYFGEYIPYSVAGDSARTATNYIAANSSGIKIANANPSTATTYQLQTATGTDFVVANAVRNRVNADGMTLYDGDGVADGNIVAKFANKLIELGKNAADAIIKLCNGKLELSYFHDTDTGIQFGSLYATNYLKLWSGFADSSRINQHSEVMAYASQGHLSTSLKSTRDTSGQGGSGGKKEAKVDAIAPEVGNARVEASFEDEGTTGSLVYDKNGIAISGWTSIKAIYMGTDVFTLSNGQWMQLKSAAQVTTLLGSGASQTNTICIAQNGDFDTYAGVVTGAMGQDGSARAYIYPNRTGGIRINYMLIRFA